MKTIEYLKRWCQRVAPSFLTDRRATPSSGFIDSFRGERAPTPRELIEQYAETAYACANINAMAVASVPIRLFRRLSSGKQSVKSCERRSWRSVDRDTKHWLNQSPHTKHMMNRAVDIVEVSEHPLLTLLDSVNPHMDGFTLMELTTLYQEMVGSAYWWLDIEHGQPSEIWPLPAHQVRVIQEADDDVITRYEFGPSNVHIPVEQMVPFHYPNLRDPYASGWSPVRAAAQSVNILNLDNAYTQALMHNRSRPDLLISPEDAMGPDERMRLEKSFSKRFAGKRAGGVHVAADRMKVTPLGYPPRDMESLARRDVTKVTLCNAHGVPVALLEAKQINRATLEGALVQHARYSIKPRCVRMFQRLNQMLVPRFGDGLFLWFDDPVPADRKLDADIRKSDLISMVLTPNEAREQLGLEPREWGEEPWIKSGMRRVDEKPPEPKPVTIPEPKPGDDDNDDKTLDDALVWGTLVDYRTHRRSRQETIAKLKWFGVDLVDAIDWTADAVVPVDDYLLPERDAKFTRADWYLKPCDKVGGHDRRLPRGSELKAILIDVFERQHADVLKQLGVKIGLVDAQTKVPKLFGPVDLSGWDKRLAADAFPVLEIMWDEGGSAAIERYGAGTDATFKVTDPATRAAIKNASLEFAESTNATTTLRLNTALDKLRARFTDVAVDGTNLPAELTKVVNGIFTGLTKNHAETIALTESSRAVHAAQRMTAETSGVVTGYKWLLSGDACPICVEIATRTGDGIPLKGDFGKTSDDPTYGVVKHPPAHPRCMCTMTEILIDVATGDTSVAPDDDSVSPPGETPRDVTGQ